MEDRLANVTDSLYQCHAMHFRNYQHARSNNFSNWWFVSRQIFLDMNILEYCRINYYISAIKKKKKSWSYSLLVYLVAQFPYCNRTTLSFAAIDYSEQFVIEFEEASIVIAEYVQCHIEVSQVSRVFRWAVIEWLRWSGFSTFCLPPIKMTYVG